MNEEQCISMDSNILLSIVNMKLRDFYSDLDSLCDDMEIRQEVLIQKMNNIGYKYDKDINQFR